MIQEKQVSVKDRFDILWWSLRKGGNFYVPGFSVMTYDLTPNIKEQILLSCQVITISRKFTLSDHILNSHALRG